VASFTMQAYVVVPLREYAVRHAPGAAHDCASTMCLHCHCRVLGACNCNRDSDPAGHHFYFFFTSVISDTISSRIFFKKRNNFPAWHAARTLHSSFSETDKKK
jgi:hypothetical protein